MRIKQTGEIGRINAADGGVVYVRLDGTNESKVFSAFADEQAAIEVVIPEPRAFAAGMKRDQSAILAALTFAWSHDCVA